MFCVIPLVAATKKHPRFRFSTATQNVSKKIPCQAGALEALAGAMLGHPMDVELLKVACGALGTICAGKDAAGRHRADLAAEVVFGGWEGLKRWKASKRLGRGCLSFLFVGF